VQRCRKSNLELGIKNYEFARPGVFELFGTPRSGGQKDILPRMQELDFLKEQLFKERIKTDSLSL